LTYRKKNVKRRLPVGRSIPTLVVGVVVVVDVEV
jgi:hypothetical protein